MGKSHNVSEKNQNYHELCKKMKNGNVFVKPSAVELVRMLRRENDGCEETNELVQLVIAQFSIQNAGSMNIFSFEGVYFNFFCVNLHFRIDVFGDAVVDV